MSSLFIQIPVAEILEPETECCWLKHNDTIITEGCDSLITLSTDNQVSEIVVVLSGFKVAVHTITLAVKKRKQIAPAIAYELEEQLAADLETCHIIYQNLVGKNQYQVAIVDKTWFESLLAVFTNLKLSLSAVTSENILLQIHALEWLLIQTEGYFLLKTPATIYNIDPQNLDYFMQQLAATCPAELAYAGTNPQLKLANIKLVELEQQASLLQLLSINYNSKQSLNFLQGAYTSKTHSKRKIMLILASLSFVGLFAYTGFAWWQQHTLQQQNTALIATRVQIFSQNFPKTKRIIDPLVQMRNQVQKLQQTQPQAGQVISLLAKVARVAGDALQAQTLSLEKLDFSLAKLSLHFTAQSLDIIGDLENSLMQQGLIVNVTSSKAENNQVQAVFILQGQ